jgi:hypothetical protein
VPTASLWELRQNQRIKETSNPKGFVTNEPFDSSDGEEKESGVKSSRYSVLEIHPNVFDWVLSSLKNANKKVKTYCMF